MHHATKTSPGSGARHGTYCRDYKAPLDDDDFFDSSSDDTLASSPSPSIRRLSESRPH